jgi:hypothetical protein
VSGVPWVTGSLVVEEITPTKLAFSAVTRFFIVTNTGGSNVRIGFTRAGVSGTLGGEPANNFMTVITGTTQQFDLRIRDLYMIGDGGSTTVDVLGGLTSIPVTNYMPLTGANPAPTGSQYLPNIE